MSALFLSKPSDLKIQPAFPWLLQRSYSSSN